MRSFNRKKYIAVWAEDAYSGRKAAWNGSFFCRENRSIVNIPFITVGSWFVFL